MNILIFKTRQLLPPTNQVPPRRRACNFIAYPRVRAASPPRSAYEHVPRGYSSPFRCELLQETPLRHPQWPCLVKRASAPRSSQPKASMSTRSTSRSRYRRRAWSHMRKPTSSQLRQWAQHVYVDLTRGELDRVITDSVAHRM
jgi:hypothetical protein